MNRIKNLFWTLQILKDTKGQDLIEYALMAGFVAVAAGAIMPGVTVTVTGTGLQKPLSATTTASGTYTFPNVPIGTYSVNPLRCR